NTAFLLNAMVENIGRFVFSLPARTLSPFAYVIDGAGALGSCPLCLWPLWLARGPRGGLVPARISLARRLRELVIAGTAAAVPRDFTIVSIFGNRARSEVFSGCGGFAQLAIDSPEGGWYSLLEMFPGATFLIGLATLSGLLFYLTSANSG